MIKDQETEQSNLGSFLTNVTPTVRSQFLPKGEIQNLNKLWHPWEREKVEYFRLSDLWHCYDEWSAYGAGVPVVLGTGETLIQYYVPYLSASQIFTSSSCVNNLREEFELGSYDPSDSFSDSFSDESESEKLWRMDGSSSEDGGSEHENLWNGRLGYLYFQYFEKSAPSVRVPLTDKINELSQSYPGLKLLRSVDLSPASWMAVAWYPIYHIPMGRTIKDLSTCFLTYHTLSSSFQDMDLEDEMEYGQSLRKKKEGEGVALPPFGLATYKLQGNVWVSDNSGQDQERLMSLLSVADSWLKQLSVQHHDFDYFMRSQRG